LRRLQSSVHEAPPVRSPKPLRFAPREPAPALQKPRFRLERRPVCLPLAGPGLNGAIFGFAMQAAASPDASAPTIEGCESWRRLFGSVGSRFSWFLFFQLAPDDASRRHPGAVEREADEGRAGCVAVDQLLLQLDDPRILGERHIGHVLVDLRDM